MARAVWYRRNVFKKVYSVVSKTLIDKFSVGTDNALYLFSTAVLRHLEILGGINLLKEFSVHLICFEYFTNHFKMSKVYVKGRTQLRKDFAIEMS